MTRPAGEVQAQTKRQIREAAKEITDGFVSPMPEWRKHRLNTIRKIERIIVKHLGGRND